MEHYLAPSILSADFRHLGEDILQVQRAGAKFLHFDVMDGLFVPSLSFGMPVLKSIRPLCDMFYDVHLMIQAPERYVQAFADAGADGITVHVEACTHLDRVLDQIHDLGLKRIWCSYYDGNERSKRTQEKLGFHFHHLTEDEYLPLLNERRTSVCNVMNTADFRKD